MSVQTETNFDLDLQDHFLTSFHNCMKDFARELDKKREVKVLESVKTLSKDDVKEELYNSREDKSHQDQQDEVKPAHELQQ